MNKSKKAILISIIFFLVFPLTVFASQVEENINEDIHIPTEPENGIPLLILTVYEDEAVIDKANEEDEEHVYGDIDLINNSIDHQVRGKGNIEIILPENFESEYGSVDIPEGPQELDYVRGRGNSSWFRKKKPYKIKFEEPKSFLGMKENKEWGLLANYTDKTLISNAIIMHTAKELGMEYTIKMVPVDFVMKGTKSGDSYLGSYYLTELVDIGNGRVEIPELKKKETENITGGYLLSLYFEEQDYDKPKSTVFTTKYSGLELINENPEFESEDLSEGRKLQRDYIRNYIDEIDDIIINNEKIDKKTHDRLNELMDLKSLADFYLIQEFFINIDAFRTSSNYLYKKPNDKIYWGPLWDFDFIFYKSELDIPDTYHGFNCHLDNPWIDNLRFKDEEFASLLHERWKELEPLIESLTKEGGIIDKYNQRGLKSWEDNNKIWPRDYEINNEEEIEKLRKFIELRRQWFNNNINNIDKEFFTISYEVDGKIVEKESVKSYSYVVDFSIEPQKEGYVYDGWINKQTGEKAEFFKIENDITLIPDFKKIDEIDSKISLILENANNLPVVPDGYQKAFTLRNNTKY